MRILSIETSGFAGSAAFSKGANLIGEVELPADRGSAATLAPAIAELFRRAGERPLDLDLIAVVHGPGSFTGLRVGVATAKTLALVSGAKIVALETHDVLVAQLSPPVLEVRTVLDASRGEVFTAEFRRESVDSAWVRVAGPPKKTREEWLSSLKRGTAVIGPMLPKMLPLMEGVVIGPDSEWRPRAATVARLALERAGKNDFVDMLSLLPQYGRDSAAEEKLRQRGG